MERSYGNSVLDIQVQDELTIFREEVRAGLSASPKQLPSRFFYDEAGSELFRRITQLPEYYLTACEHEILARSSPDIISLVKEKQFNLVELGPGDGSKGLSLIEAATADGRHLTYAPIDVSFSAMETVKALLASSQPSVEVRGIVAEYSPGLELLKGELNGRTLVLFLGSNLGNLNPNAAVAFLRRISRTLSPGDLLVIGLDLRKDEQTMTRAYNDSQGITAEFNLNLLTRINRELGGHFDVRKFRYESRFEPEKGGMESYLVSLCRQSVPIGELRRSFDFRRDEPIHTEHSHKYTDAEIRELAERAGFVIETDFRDSRRYFVDSVWRVPA